MTRRRELLTVARLEFSEVLRSRWLLFCLAIYAALGAIFVVVGMRESGVMGFTGMGRVLLSFTHALLLLLPLLGLTATGQVVNRAREEGVLELLFSHPIRRSSYFVGVSFVRLGTLAAPLFVLLPGMALWGALAFGEGVGWGFLARSLAVGTSLLAVSVALGLWISTVVRNQAKALMLVVLTWATLVALLDFGLIGLMLQWRLEPRAIFALATLNPVQCARMALLSAAEPDLGTFGPVGFFLANRVGPTVLFALGVGWPLVLAATVWSWTLRRFSTGDLV